MNAMNSFWTHYITLVISIICTILNISYVQAIYKHLPIINKNNSIPLPHVPFMHVVTTCDNYTGWTYLRWIYKSVDKIYTWIFGGSYCMAKFNLMYQSHPVWSTCVIVHVYIYMWTRHVHQNMYINSAVKLTTYCPLPKIIIKNTRWRTKIIFV